MLISGSGGWQTLDLGPWGHEHDFDGAHHGVAVAPHTPNEIVANAG